MAGVIFIFDTDKKFQLTKPWSGRHVLILGLFSILSTAVLLEPLKKFEQNLLRDFTPSSL